MNNVKKMIFWPDKKDPLYGRMEVQFIDGKTAAIFSRSTLSGFIDLTHGLGLCHVLYEGHIYNCVEQIAFPTHEAMEDYISKTKAKA